MKNSSFPGMSVKRNFTLIELLVVIAIIAILASILMPALQSARQRGQSAACLNNLKSLGMACQNYSEDYNGWLPRKHLELQEVWICRLKMKNPSDILSFSE